MDTTADDNDLATGNADGTTSLREAILRANAEPAKIDFAIPASFANGNGTFTIKPASALPTLTNRVTIDGYTQSGAQPNNQANSDNAVLKIELDGISAGTNVDGLTIAAANCTVKGLAVNDYHYGIHILSGGGGALIEGDFVGADTSGATAKSNTTGVAVESAANTTIGGAAPTQRNVISGNSFGVSIFGDGASGNQVLGNFIGVAADGGTRIANGVGVFIGEGAVSGNTIGGTFAGARNIISGNGRGVWIDGAGATANLVEGNDIGTTAAGDTAVGNFDGVVIIEGASSNVIGADGTGNVISGNANNGGTKGLRNSPRMHRSPDWSPP